MRVVVFACAALLLASGAPFGATESKPPRRMSFHNRLLLNRAVVSGLKSIEVLVLAAKSESGGFQASTQEIAALVGRLGGHVLRSEREIGYAIVDLPTARLIEFVDSPAVAAYQIASLSKSAWYRDGPRRPNAEMYRGFEVTPIAPNEPSTTFADLPRLSVEASRMAGNTADEDVGLAEWYATHPTFDGRGVTIAIVENAVPAFTNPVFKTARTLDGRKIPKIAGIVNVMSPEVDDSRVTLDTPVPAEHSWARIGARTYILPSAGEYRFGRFVLPAGGNVVHQFGVLEDTGTHKVWIDTNGDASFQDETPLPDVNERFEPRFLKLTHPRKVDVSFVMGRGDAPAIVHIYIARGSHHTMTASVAAGSRTEESLASGVAPNARLLLVRHDNLGAYEMKGALQGFIEAAKRPDVDVIGTAAGFTFLPDTSADFAGMLFQRLVDVYGKPILMSAGNNYLKVAQALDFGSALSVGGALGPRTFAALYGGRALDGLMVHPASAAGPSIDGAIKPDFLAPMERLAADLPWNRRVEAIPRNKPAFRLPAGYTISCCTSASAPYAAGVAALLISAAKQTNLPYSAQSLARAMTVSARFLPRFGAHEQGNGVLDIKAAWRALARPLTKTRIVAATTIVHPLAQYAARGSQGVGIFEFEGWKAGMSGRREVRLRRESGPAAPVTYRLRWTGNDGTFSAPNEVTLPLGGTVAVPIGIAVKTTGTHSALLDLRDMKSDAIVFRTLATIVASEPFNPARVCARVTGVVRLMSVNTHYFEVPPGMRLLRFEVETIRGTVMPAIISATGLYPENYLHDQLHYVGTGTHVVVIPNPEPGTWSVTLLNASKWIPMGDELTPDDQDAEYAVTVGVVGAAIGPPPMQDVQRRPGEVRARGDGDARVRNDQPVNASLGGCEPSEPMAGERSRADAAR